jgi:DNA-directed RNA polymerase alpha subunit
MAPIYFNNAHISNPICNRYEFDIENLDLSIINGIRRIILSKIPVLGFKGEDDPSIVIHKNNGPLHNEFMIHRIGMIPIHFSEEATESFTEGEYEFSCTVKNNDYDILNVTTRDFTGKRNNTELTAKELHLLFPENNVTKQPVLVTRLRQGEELSFTATVVKSIATEHASFSPVSLCSFYYTPDMSKMTKEMSILDKERTYLKNDYGEASHIRFMIESELNLSPKYLVAKALEILIQKVDGLTTKSTMELNSTIPNTIDITIRDEDDTLGNIIQSLLFNKYIRQKVKTLNKYDVSYVGYYAPHPLDKTIVVRITVQSDNTLTIDEFEKVMQESIRHVEQELKTVYDDWIRFD